ncbi:hypothetical protein ACWEPB_18025 [Kitasatospora cineracea]
MTPPAGATPPAVRVDPVEAGFGHHWWTVRELATADATVRPRDLAARLTALLREGPGPVPLHLGDVNDDEDR